MDRRILAVSVFFGLVSIYLLITAPEDEQNDALAFTSSSTSSDSSSGVPLSDSLLNSLPASHPAVTSMSNIDKCPMLSWSVKKQQKEPANLHSQDTQTGSPQHNAAAQTEQVNDDDQQEDEDEEDESNNDNDSERVKS